MSARNVKRYAGNFPSDLPSLPKTAIGSTFYDVLSSTEYVFKGTTWEQSAAGGGSVSYAKDYQGGETVPQDTIVGNGEFLMISNKPTSDYPYIQVQGTPVFNTDDFTDSGTANSAVVYGNRFVTNHAIEITGVKFFASSVSATGTFVAYLRIYTNTPDEEGAQVYMYSGLPLVAGEAMEITSATRYALEGQTIEIFMISADNASNTNFTHNYVYTGAASTVAGRGEVNTNPNRQLVRINYYTENDSYVKADIDKITVGSFIQLTQGDAFERYEVVELRTPADTDTSFVVNLAESSAGLVIGNTTEVYVEIPDAEGSIYDYETNHWSGNEPSWADSVVGVLQIDGADEPGVEANAYATDIRIAGVSKSDDWDILIL